MSDLPEFADDVETACPNPNAQNRRSHRRISAAGEAASGLWQRVSFHRAIIEGTFIFAVWRLLVLAPITFWPGGLFPFILFALLIMRFSPPVWSAMRIIATRREKMSKRFFKLSLLLSASAALMDVVIALAVGDPAQPFGGPLFGPDLPRLLAHGHALLFSQFAQQELTSGLFLIVYFLIATICTRLAQGGFLRFTMPSGNGRVTL